MHCRNIRRTQAFDLISRQWLARLGREFLLLPFERHRRWRRRSLSDNGPVNNFGRRVGSTVGDWRRRSKNTASGWSHLSPPADLRRLNIPLVYGDSCPFHGLSACKSALRDDGHRTGRGSIRVPDFPVVSVVASIVVGDLIVVDVYDRSVVNGRVADVDASYVFATGSIRGHIHFPWAQRKPSHVANAGPSSDRNRQTKTRAANKDHKRGRIDRPGCDRAGHPAPIASRIYPAAIVEGSVAPWFVVNPRPAPR
jgi:hypothetical protein